MNRKVIGLIALLLCTVLLLTACGGLHNLPIWEQSYKKF